MAGIFGSTDNQSNGIAIFANLSGLFGDKGYYSDEYIFQPEYVRKRTKRRLARKLRRLMRKKMQIEFK